MGAAKLRRKALGDAYGLPPCWAWHYTLGRKIPLILSDGMLRDAWTEDNSNEFADIPCSVWFTTSETIDPTSVPALTLDNAFGFDREAFKRIAGGAWRIGLPLPHTSLNTYEEALALHSPKSPFGSWLRQLTSHGANRKQWRMAWQALPILDCRVEEQKGGTWVAHSIESLPLDANGPGYGSPGVMVNLSFDDFIDGEFHHFLRNVA